MCVGRVEVEVEAAGQAQAQAVLEGVVCVLSGYANPERARVRAIALALGARVARHWGPACTHLMYDTHSIYHLPIHYTFFFCKILPQVDTYLLFKEHLIKNTTFLIR